MTASNIENIKHIALLNFGGIGDEILFEPVIRAIKKYFPHSQITFFLEDRSKAAIELLPPVDEVKLLPVQSSSRAAIFSLLLKRLTKQPYDMVISSGSSPFIPVMLKCTRIPYRFGFNTGVISQLFLTEAAPLDLTIYAGQMYFSLAKTALSYFKINEDNNLETTTPLLSVEETKQQQWQNIFEQSGRLVNLLVHPGVSQVSQDKQIVKRWCPKKWAETIEILNGQVHIHLVGGPDDLETITDICQQLPSDLANFTNHFGKTESISDLSAMIKATDMMLCLDSAPMHIAVGHQKPLVALFGPALKSSRLLPASDHFIAINSGQINEAETKSFINIDVDTVVEAVKTQKQQQSPLPINH